MKTALVAIAKNEDNYLKEWVDHHLDIGFDEIFIFQNNWRYGKSDVIYPNVHLLECDGHRMQNPCYNTFILNNHKRYDFATFLDIDEFLHIKSGEKVDEWLGGYADSEIIYVNWRLFGDNGLDFAENGNYSVLDRFKMCSRTLSPLGKIFINFRKMGSSVRFFNPHIVIMDGGGIVLPNYVFPNRKTAVKPWMMKESEMSRIGEQPVELWHFRNKTYQECYDRKYNQDDAFHEASECDFLTDLDMFNRVFKEHNRNDISVEEIK